MNPLPVFLSTIVLLSSVLSSMAQSDNHPSRVSEVLASYTPAKVDAHTPEAMAGAASAFLDSLDETLKAQALLPNDSPEKQKWTNVPPRGPQGGVRLGDCNKKQLQLACDLLATVLSKQGYEKVRNIMLADDRLLRGGRPRPGFGAENFWLAVFGDPSATAPWALQLDGHHVAVNLAFHGDHVGMSPSFIGTQPAAFKLAGKEIVPMAGEVDDAFALMNSLDDTQQEKAIIGPRRGRIATAAGKDGVVPDPAGIECRAFGKKQRALLAKLLRQYVGDLPEPYAGKRLKDLKAEIDAMHFAWNGPTVEDSDVSYRIQGPTLIIEYACQDLGGNPLDHLHSMYRDPTNEYGAGFE